MRGRIRKSIQRLHMPTINNVFSSDGLLAKTIKGFVPRDAQTEMAKAVKHAIDHR